MSTELAYARIKRFDHIDPYERRECGVIQDPDTWEYIRWCRDVGCGTLRLSIGDCYRFLRIRRSEKPNASKVKACVGRSAAACRLFPLDDYLDGRTTVQRGIPFHLLPRLIAPLAEVVRSGAAQRMPALIDFVTNWEKQLDVPSQRPCLCETTCECGNAVSLKCP